VGGFGTRLGSARTSRIYRRPSISICVRRSGCWIDRRELTLSMGCSGYVADASYVMLIRASRGQLKVFGIKCILPERHAGAAVWLVAAALILLT